MLRAITGMVALVATMALTAGTASAYPNQIQDIWGFGSGGPDGQCVPDSRCHLEMSAENIDVDGATCDIATTLTIPGSGYNGLFYAADQPQISGPGCQQPCTLGTVAGESAWLKGYFMESGYSEVSVDLGSMCIGNKIVGLDDFAIADVGTIHTTGIMEFSTVGGTWFGGPSPFAFDGDWTQTGGDQIQFQIDVIYG
jgi:hypothetical protein